MCWRCEVCLHQYSCTCPDSVILSTICVHIHLIRIFVLNPQHVPLAGIRSSVAAALSSPKPFVNTTKNIGATFDITSSSSSSLKKISQNTSSSSFNNKDNLKISIQNKCISIMAMLRNNGGNKKKWNRECLLSCDQQLEIVHNLLEYKNGNNTCGTPGKVSQGSRRKPPGHAKMADNNMSVTTSPSATVASEARVSAQYTLDQHLVTTDGVLVLQEDNGRYRYRVLCVASTRG